jgi:hypothetical protein
MKRKMVSTNETKLMESMRLIYNLIYITLENVNKTKIIGTDGKAKREQSKTIEESCEF